jgi:hypothetical protein
MGALEATTGRYRSLRLSVIADDLAALLSRAEVNEVSYLTFADMLAPTCSSRTSVTGAKPSVLTSTAGRRSSPATNAWKASTISSRPRLPNARSTRCWTLPSSARAGVQ